MFSMGKSKLGCSEEEVQRPEELILFEVNILLPEHLYRNVGERTSEQAPSGELQGC
jgi:hypothetical protein